MKIVEYMWVNIWCMLIVPAKVSEHEGSISPSEQNPISKIIKFLLKTNDRRGGMPDWAILSATYASAKTLDC